MRRDSSNCRRNRFTIVRAARWDDWIPVARVGRPVNRVFPVQFVLPDDDREGAEAREAVSWSLDYYLIELGEPDPWEYAIYHTKTLANMYSRVHWRWIRQSGRPAEAISGEQIVLCHSGVTDGNRLRKPLPLESCAANRRKIDTDGISDRCGRALTRCPPAPG